MKIYDRNQFTIMKSPVAGKEGMIFSVMKNNTSRVHTWVSKPFRIRIHIIIHGLDRKTVIWVVSVCFLK